MAENVCLDAENVMGNMSRNAKKSCEDPFRIVVGDTNVGVCGERFSVRFSGTEGGISSLVYDGTEYVTRTPKATYWRPCTDNDRGCKHGFDTAMWFSAGLFQRQKGMRVEKSADAVRVQFTWEIPNANGAEYTVSDLVDRVGSVHVRAPVWEFSLPRQRRI